MARRNTKADRILNAARERLEVARSNVETAEGQLGLARAAFNAHQMAYYALEQELRPTPRKASTKKPTATQGAKEPTADKEPVPPGLCAYKFESGGVCLSPASNAIHDPTMGYRDFHEFVAAKPARKKREKKDPPAVIPIEGQGVDLAVEMES